MAVYIKLFNTLLLLIFSFGHLSVQAQNDTTQNPLTIWSNINAFTPTLVSLPDNYDSTKSHTLVIGLHGFGSTAESFQRLSNYFTEAGFIYATPEAPYSFLKNDGTIGYEWFLYDISSYIMLERPASEREKAAMRLTTEKQMAQVMTDLKRSFNIDKIYFLGFSQGGIITYLTGIHHHDKVDGMIIFSSVVDEDWLGNDNIKEGKSVPTLIIQGETDKLVPINFAENGRDLLIRNGYDVTYQKFDGGHTIPQDLMGFVIDWINKE
ncbi:alpha/beta hydrolase [Mangrovivirga sp. M17]|uniref:Alpha/beta hydrolase n=1 Tax=Mangrovivirga halotolerans TaxID=2993936 RepID=A0ABT3RUX0_9BACT|nr:alpha/beta hydrolase [Mangrovivirga halotolerans]MCX2745456.1 alpha/beta hydrolase [Mangrovivirga halotolerans]